MNNIIKFIKDFFNKNWVTIKSYGYLLGLVILVILGIYVFDKASKRIQSLDKINTELKKEILLKDSMIVHRDGVYSKLVDDMKTAKEMNEFLKSSYSELYTLIKKNNERVLTTTEFKMWLKEKETTSSDVKIVVTDKDTSFNYIAKYPDEINPFIEYQGDVNLTKKVVNSKWKFNPVKVGIVLTEKSNGMWNTYIDAPEYFQIGDLKVNSLPKSEIASKKERNLHFYGGAGYIKMNHETKPTINGGVSYKKWMISGSYGGKDTHTATLMRKF